MRPQHVLYVSLFASGIALAFSSPSYANVVISIDKSTQHMVVSVDGTTRYDWPVSTGRPGYDTPNGTFRPNRMEPIHYSKEYENAPMPDSMFFDTRGHAIHGFFDTPHLGMAVSHGCVRLSPANADTLYNLVKQEGMANTTVQISGHIPARAPLVAQRRTPAQQVAVAPSYGQPVGTYPGRWPYGPAYGEYGRSAFPPQPAPAYGRRGYYRTYGGQAYYRQPYSGYAQQPRYGGPFSPY